MDYTANAMIYPRSKDSNPDEASAKYHEYIDNASGWNRVALGEFVKIERGVCRHQCILEHLLLQRAGIDSRLASGAANTSSGDFRGYHIWCEVTLADGRASCLTRPGTTQPFHFGRVPTRWISDASRWDTVPTDTIVISIWIKFKRVEGSQLPGSSLPRPHLAPMPSLDLFENRRKSNRVLEP